MRLHWLLSSRLLWAESNPDSQVVEAEPVEKSTFHLSHLSSSLVMFVFPTVSFPVSSLPTIQSKRWTCQLELMAFLFLYRYLKTCLSLCLCGLKHPSLIPFDLLFPFCLPLVSTLLMSKSSSILCRGANDTKLRVNA